MKFMTVNRRAIVLVTASLALSASLSWASDADRGTRPEAKTLAEAAAAHIDKVGSEQAFKDFGAEQKWRIKDMYVFVQTMDATMTYHGANTKLVGKNFAEVKDSSGKEFNKEMIAAAKKGTGWVDYQWAHPVSKKVEDKTSYIVRVNKPDGFVGVGIYR
jgi:cytochrome c